MAEQSKFGQKPQGLRCDEWEALLADALDGLLPPGRKDAFEAHSHTCEGCADLLSHARQGREWLAYLHTEPDIPQGLLGRILDRTTGSSAIPVQVLPGAQGAGVAALPFRRSFHEARLMMTVAMAFFSIALTLNLIGIRVTSLRLADLRPSVIGSTLSRDFYSARGQVVRYYENMRFVYQLESRMRELRRDVETQAAPPAQPQTNNGQKTKSGQSRAVPETGTPVEAEQHNPAVGTRQSVLRAELAVSAPKQNIHAGHGSATTSTLAEAEFSISLGHLRAGLQRFAQNEGRSLA